MKKISENCLFEVESVVSSPLMKKFVIPPFSILDTTQGYWIDRVREWKALGIKSEVGRGDNLLFSESIADFAV